MPPYTFAALVNDTEARRLKSIYVEMEEYKKKGKIIPLGQLCLDERQLADFACDETAFDSLDYEHIESCGNCLAYAMSAEMLYGTKNPAGISNTAYLKLRKRHRQRVAREITPAILKMLEKPENDSESAEEPKPDDYVM